MEGATEVGVLPACLWKSEEEEMQQKEKDVQKNEEVEEQEPKNKAEELLLQMKIRLGVKQQTIIRQRIPMG